MVGIALVDQNEEEPGHFYSLIHDTLFERGLQTENTSSARRQRLRALRLLNLSLNIVYHWGKDANNLRPALLCAERAVLFTWDWMRQGNLFESQSTREGFEQLLTTYLTITIAYVSKLRRLCLVQDGLFGQGADELEYPLRTFEVIGAFGALIMVLKDVVAIEENDSVQSSLIETMQHIAQLLAALIGNNPSAMTPRFDGHSIDIALGLLGLTEAGLYQEATVWVNRLGQQVVWAYQLGRHFPIYTDSYDDLVAMRYGQAPPKEKLMELSTLLPMLAHWHAVLDMSGDLYSSFQKTVAMTFPGTDLQLWFPNASTENHLYRENAGPTSGAILSSVELPDTMEGLKAHIVRLHQVRHEFEALSCFAQGWPSIGLIASRHFRTPVIPAYWQQAINRPPHS